MKLYHGRKHLSTPKSENPPIWFGGFSKGGDIEMFNPILAGGIWGFPYALMCSSLYS